MYLFFGHDVETAPLRAAVPIAMPIIDCRIAQRAAAHNRIDFPVDTDYYDNAQSIVQAIFSKFGRPEPRWQLDP